MLFGFWGGAPNTNSSSGGGGGGGDGTSSNTTISGGVRVQARLISDFQYPVDVHVLRAMKEGRMHEWTNVELRSICRKHDLKVGGAKTDLAQRVCTHFSQLYKESLPNA